MFSLSYMGSLGRELINGVDQNYDVAPLQTVTYTVKGQAQGTGKGSLPGPLADGSTFSTKVFSNTSRPNTNYAALVDLTSHVTSTYHAMPAQLTHPLAPNPLFHLNHTWAQAMRA